MSSSSDQDRSSNEGGESSEDQDEGGKKSSEEPKKQNAADDESDQTDNSSDFDVEPLSRHRLLRYGLIPEQPKEQSEESTVQMRKSRPSKRLEMISVGSDEEESAGEESALSEKLSTSEDEDVRSPTALSDAVSNGSDANADALTPEAGVVEGDNGDAAMSGDEAKDDDDEDLSCTPKGRRQIRKILEVEQLAKETQEALREEQERRKRLAQRERVRLEEERRAQAAEEAEVVIVAESPAVAPLVLEHDDATHESVLQVDTHLLCKLKPHQREGVRFLWDSCCESVAKVKASPGSGCILAHCMGLGKTLQVITFLHTVLTCRLVPLSTALVVCPLNTVLNWKAEFDKWQRGVTVKKLEVVEFSSVKTAGCRVEALSRWHREGGVMILSYEMYRILTHGHQAKYAKHQHNLCTALQNPGPDVVVCDEGHILRNQTTAIFKAMSSIHTRRRIVLTGTPLQNNLTEYHCMVSFTKANLLGSRKEFRNRFINPIQNGQCADSTPSDVRLMKKRVHVLHELLAGCVQRRDYSALTLFLPPKQEYVLSVRMTPIQCTLYRHYLQTFTREGHGVNRLFQDFQILSLIWTHPWCLQLADLNKGHSGQRSEVTVPGHNGAAQVEEEVRSGPPLGWHRQFVCDADAGILEHSGKLILLMEILHLAEQLQDKVLVFSQSLVSLDLIESFLAMADKAKKTGMESLYKEKSWVRDKDYYRLDGSTTALMRKKWAQEFNNIRNSRGRLFLISTRAGSLGINLVAANRVVVFDASWNPSYDIQSIFRVYRFGQRKPVSVYRFLAQGTMEQRIYERQVAKQSLSSRVVDQQQIQRHFTHSQLSELYRFQPDLHIKTHNSSSSKDSVLRCLLQQCEKSIVSFHEHDSLLDHRVEEELTVEERKAAWEEYRAEETASVQDGEVSVPTDLWKKTNTELEALLKKGRIELQKALLNLEARNPEFYMQEVRRRNPLLSEEQIKQNAVQASESYERDRQRRIEVYQRKLKSQQALIICIQQILVQRRGHASASTSSSAAASARQTLPHSSAQHSISGPASDQNISDQNISSTSNTKEKFAFELL